MQEKQSTSDKMWHKRQVYSKHINAYFLKLKSIELTKTSVILHNKFFQPISPFQKLATTLTKLGQYKILVSYQPCIRGMFNGANQDSFKYMIVAENNTLSDFCGNGFSMTHTFILQFLKRVYPQVFNSHFPFHQCHSSRNAIIGLVSSLPQKISGHH